MRFKTIWLVLTSAILISLIAAGCAAEPSLHGGVINPPYAAPEIKMLDQNGDMFQLSSLRGKVVLIYFGFTNCPDECPTTMAHIKLALDSLTSKANNVQVVFITTDPVNDTPQALKDFLGKFSPDFIGIPGTQAQMESVWSAYGVTVLNGGETHSSFTYVIDKAGNVRETFNPDSTSTDMAVDLNTLLSEK